MTNFRRPNGPLVTWTLTSNVHPEESSSATGTMQCHGCKTKEHRVKKSAANEHAHTCLGSQS